MLKKILTRARVLFFFLGLSIILSQMAADPCSGYIMPAEQLIDFMTDKFSGFQTLSITQSTLRIQNGQEVIFTEQLIFKSPDLFHLNTLDQRVERPEPPDMNYRQLLMASPEERIERLLTAMGIRVDSVSLTRMDGTIAYRIGDKEPDSPELLIDKERFLPIFLRYRPPEGMPGDQITVRFQDYRELEKGWFPFDITYSKGDRVKERYTVLTFQANNPVDTSLLKPFDLRPSQGRPVEEEPLDVEEERLRKIIKTFEEKYQ